MAREAELTILVAALLFAGCFAKPLPADESCPALSSGSVHWMQIGLWDKLPEAEKEATSLNISTRAGRYQMVQNTGIGGEEFKMVTGSHDPTTTGINMMLFVSRSGNMTLFLHILNLAEEGETRGPPTDAEANEELSQMFHDLGLGTPSRQSIHFEWQCAWDPAWDNILGRTTTP